MGTVTRLVIYLARPAGVSQRMRPVIYRDAAGSPRARVARGRSARSLRRREASGLLLPAPVALAPGTYWLGLLTGDTSQATVHFLGTTPGKKVSGLRVGDSGAIFIFSGQERIWGLYRCASSGSVMIDAASMPACS